MAIRPSFAPLEEYFPTITEASDVGTGLSVT
jgi:hypothetical protein